MHFVPGAAVAKIQFDTLSYVEKNYSE